MLDLSIWKILVLAVIAMVVFGPEQLPKVATQAGRMLHELRRIADGARDDLREGLGPEFENFDIADLNPRYFVQKHLLDGIGTEAVQSPAQSAQSPPAGATAAATTLLDEGEAPPYDTEAT